MRTNSSTQRPELITLRPDWRWLQVLSKLRHDCGRMLPKRIWHVRNIFIMGGATMPARWQSWRVYAEPYRMIRVCSN